MFLVARYRTNDFLFGFVLFSLDLLSSHDSTRKSETYFKCGPATLWWKDALSS
jgi:hypothetical protein